MNIAPLKREIEQLAKDKGIDRDTIIGALEEAMKSGGAEEVRSGDARSRRASTPTPREIELFEFREVVESARRIETIQIMLDRGEANTIRRREVGDEIGVQARHQWTSDGFLPRPPSR